MGNQTIHKARSSSYRNKIIQDNQYDSPQPLRGSIYRKNNRQNRNNTINASIEVPKSRQINSSTIDQFYYDDVKDNKQKIRKNSNNQQSLQSQEKVPIIQNKKSKQNDRILQKLSLKNQELRGQLKKISDQLTEKLKRKKFVPKKKNQEKDQDYSDNKLSLAGVKRQLENAYKQIDMYKRTLQTLKGKEGNQEITINKIQRLQNNIVDLDLNINNYIKKIQGIKKVKKGQQSAIQKDLNDQMHENIQAYRRQCDQIKEKLKEYGKRDRQRQQNYKRQQAYLCEVQKKWRIMNNQYFHNKKTQNIKQKNNRKTASSDKTQKGDMISSYGDFQLVRDTLLELKTKHDEYNKKITTALQAKNKIIEQHNDVKTILGEKQQILAALIAKIDQLKRINKPTKKNIFGGYQSYPDQQTLSEFARQSQLQVVEQKQPDLFDIKHLLANIPKPVRKKPVLEEVVIENGDPKSPKKKLVNKIPQMKKMATTLEKSEPKKWDNILSRNQQRGKTFKAQLKFNDAQQFEQGCQPLIVGMNIWVSNNNDILGIQAIYLKKQDIRYGYKSSSVSQGTILHYNLQRPDYLKNITGYFSPQGFIQHLVFSSKQGKTGRYGNLNDDMEPFNFGLSSSERPFLISGASTLYESTPKLNKLGIQICGQM